MLDHIKKLTYPWFGRISSEHLDAINVAKPSLSHKSFHHFIVTKKKICLIFSLITFID